MRKFIETTLNKVPIYKGKKIGTTLENIKGHKTLNNGFIESELEREITEGMPLNPGIKEVKAVDIYKDGKTLCIDITVELQNGEELEERFNVDIS